jgi:hypothetical protein
MFATLVAKVRALTNSSTSKTSDAEIVDYVANGVRYVLNTLPLELCAPFSVFSSSITSNTKLTIDTNKVISVLRNDIRCDKVPLELSYEIGDSNSIFLATARYPAFYLDNGGIYIKPNPTTAAVGKATIVDIEAKAAALSSTDTSSIGQYDGIVIKYASALDYMGLSGYWGESILENLNSTEVTSGARDALTKARNLIDNSTGMSTGEDAEYYIDLEDTEMVQSIVQTASQEVNRALAEMRGPEGSASHTQQMLLKSQQLFQQAERELLLAINRNLINDPTRTNGESRQS